MLSSGRSLDDIAQTGKAEGFKVLAGQHIRVGSSVDLRGGYLVKTDATAFDANCGVSLVDFDLSYAGAVDGGPRDGPEQAVRLCQVDIGGPKMEMKILGPFRQSDVSKVCWAVDDETVRMTALGSEAQKGRIARYISPSRCIVQFAPF